MKDYRNPGGYKYNGRKMNSDYANNQRAEIARNEASMNNSYRRPHTQDNYYDERDGIPINPISAMVMAGLVIGAVGFGLYWVKGWMNAWASHDLPWNYIAGYYNIIFGWTIDTFPRVWGWLKTTINTPVAVIGIFLYAILVMIIYMKLYISISYRVMRRTTSDQRWIFLANVLLLPLVLGGLFSMVKWIF